MSRDELLKLVKGIVTMTEEETGRKYTEKEIDRTVQIFSRNIVSALGSDLIFYPDDCGLPANPTIEEIVDRALQTD